MLGPGGREKESHSDLEDRELRDLWISVAIAISLATYHIMFSLSDLVRRFVLGYTRLLSDLLYLWIVWLLLVAYRRWQRATARQKELKNIITSIATEVIMVVSPDRRIQMCNESVKNIFGYAPEELVGGGTDRLYLDRRQDKSCPGEIYRMVNTVGFHVGGATGIRKNGETFPLEIVTALLRGKRGAVLLMRDVSERQRLEQLRDNLIHMMIHDMRTPTQVVLASLDLFQTKRGESLDAKERGWIESMDNQVRVLMTMFDSVLDVSRLESGALPLRKSALDLRLVVREALGSIGTLADRHVVVVDEPAEPLVLELDRELVRRVVVNLLTNAVKFTPAGGEIRIGVERGAEAATVSVRDSGPDIPREHHARIFEKFGQTEAGKQLHSFGLGLTFCKLAVEAHGGRIGVESAPGQGATFRFSLPLGRT